jgi:hypothetical protein
VPRGAEFGILELGLEAPDFNLDIDLPFDRGSEPDLDGPAAD